MMLNLGRIIKNNFNSLFFFLSFAVGPLSLILSPDSFTKVYFQTYSISNFLFSLFWTLFFLKENNIKKRIASINFILLIIFALNLIFEFNLVVWLYVFSILMVDLISTQIRNKTITFTSRLISIILLLLLFLNKIKFDTFLNYRIIISICLSLIIYFSNYEVKKLKIDKPLAFIIITFVFYSGSVVLFSFLLNELPVHIFKILIILFQVGLVLMLKELDYKTRFNSNEGGLFFLITGYASIGILFPALYFVLKYPSVFTFLSIVLYCLSYFALNYSRKFLADE